MQSRKKDVQGMSKLYGMFVIDQDGKRHWALETNKRRAIKAVKKYPIGEVRSVSYGHSSSWDSPTFRMCSERVFSHNLE